MIAFGLFAWSGHLVQYLVLWILPLVTVVQAILRLRAIAEHGATSDFSSPLTAARINLPELHREMARRGMLEGAEVLPFRLTLQKIFNRAAIASPS